MALSTLLCIANHFKIKNSKSIQLILKSIYFTSIIQNCFKKVQYEDDIRLAGTHSIKQSVKQLYLCLNSSILCNVYNSSRYNNDLKWRIFKINGKTNDLRSFNTPSVYMK